MSFGVKRILLGALCASVLSVGFGAASAQAAFDDPLFIVTPIPPLPKNPGEMLPHIPPPNGELEDACGLAVDEEGNVYVSDYFNDTVDAFGPSLGPKYTYGYLDQIPAVDPIDGPCGVAVDPDGNVFVNDYHRAVVKYPGLPNFGVGTTIAGYPVDESEPTGVAIDPDLERVFVDERDHVAVFDLFGGPEGEVGGPSLIDGYGLAVSQFPATKGFVYVADAADNTVKVYDPETEPNQPALEIDGSETPLGRFVSLRDSSLAVDDETGELYVVDDLEPQTSDRPEAVVYVFEADGTYEGRLKDGILFSQPVGIAVDNSATANRGRVYVTSGNSERSSIYVYPPHAATDAEVPLPPNPVVGTSVPGEEETSKSAAIATLATASGPLAPAVSAAAQPGSLHRPRAKHRSHRPKRLHHRVGRHR